MPTRNVAAIVLIAALWTLFVHAPQLAVFDGASVDSLFWLRSLAFNRRFTPQASPAVVVAIDEETTRREPFADLPLALWTPQLAPVVQALVAANAAVIGFDVILPTSGERLVAGYDRPFLLALHDGAAGGRIVLAKVQSQVLPLQPFPGQVLAVGGESNVRSTNLYVDHDDVVRQVPLWFRSADAGASQSWEPSFALDVAARAADVRPIRTTAGTRLGEWQIPTTGAGTVLLTFDGGSSVPTFSLADLAACAVDGRAAYFAQHFAHRVVLIGSLLDIEDRKLTSQRFLPAPAAVASSDRCALAPMSGLVRSDVVLDQLPGVYVQAAAIDDLLRHDVLVQPAPAVRALSVAVLSLSMSAALVLLPVTLGAAIATILLLTWIGGTAAAFHAGFLLPLLPALVAAVGCGLSGAAYRFAITDRAKRRLHRIFGLYVAPSVVDKLAASETMPELGGERRDMTFLFTDVADFTSLSERMDPTELGATINAYLERVCETIMEHGGLVNEFLGDGVLAFFGAPLPQPDHARRAIACAVALEGVTDAFRAEQEQRGIAFGRTRIGLHTGEAVVGNFGSLQRLKYTALGDTVNTASRIEGLNKFFGTTVAVSVETLRGLDPSRFRPLGEFVLKGRHEPLAVFELLSSEAASSPYTERYRAAYADLQAGSARADELFFALAAERPDDGCVAFYLARLRAGIRATVITMEAK